MCLPFRLVQEYCDCGTLGHITGDWKASGECEQCMLSRLLLLQDCAQGLKALHNQHVVHGDLVRSKRGATACRYRDVVGIKHMPIDYLALSLELCSSLQFPASSA